MICTKLFNISNIQYIIYLHIYKLTCDFSGFFYSVIGIIKILQIQRVNGYSHGEPLFSMVTVLKINEKQISRKKE